MPLPPRKISLTRLNSDGFALAHAPDIFGYSDTPRLSVLYVLNAAAISQCSGLTEWPGVDA